MSAEWRPDASGVYEHRWWDVYIGAELLIDLQQYDYVMPWARYARDLGCELVDAVLHAESGRRRQEYWSPILSTITGYTSERHVRAMDSNPPGHAMDDFDFDVDVDLDMDLDGCPTWSSTTESPTPQPGSSVSTTT